MAEIVYFSAECIADQLDGKTVKPEIFATNESLGHWLASHYKDRKVPFEIFEGDPCAENLIFKSPDVTLNCHGKYTIMETPGEGATIAYIVLAIVAAVAVVALTPEPITPGNVNRSQESPNNKLAGRSNQARILERVPDIRGTDLSYPDVAMPSYNLFVGGVEEEHGYYCVGRGRYSFELMADGSTFNVKDGDTPISLIDGASAQFYEPETYPFIDAPYHQIGDLINRPIYIPYRSNEVAGDKLGVPAFNVASSSVYFSGGSVAGTSFIRIVNANWPDEYYKAGEQVTIVATIVDDGGNNVNISGVYTIASVLSKILLLDDDFPFPFVGLRYEIPGGSGYIQSSGSDDDLPYKYFTRDTADKILVNILAPAGLYLDNGGDDYLGVSIDYSLEYELLNADNEPTGISGTVDSNIQGSSNTPIGSSIEFELPYSSRFRARVVRKTGKIKFDGVVSDELKWADMYGLKTFSLPTALEGGYPFTTIQTKTIATPAATSVKHRKINCVVTEMVKKYLGFGVFDTVYTPNNSPFQSFIADAIDPDFGNRPLSEIDADGLLALESDVQAYFGNDIAQFNYTIDTTDITFQEYTYMLFNAAFCIPCRGETQISAFFDGPQLAPAKLFTHRSKVPGEETYSRQPISTKDYDGVELVWFDPSQNYSSQTIIEADTVNPVNLRRVEISGIKNLAQATIRAKREWNKIKFSRLQLDFTSTAEARYVRVGQMISVVKGSRIHTQDGEILAVNGLELTLSQDVDVQAGYSIMLKDEFGVPESRTVTQGAAANKVVISSLPTSPIRTGIDTRRTEFSIGSDSSLDAQRWIPQEVDIGDVYTVKMQCINYADEYYQDDGINLRGFSNGFDEGFGV